MSFRNSLIIYLVFFGSGFLCESLSAQTIKTSRFVSTTTLSGAAAGFVGGSLALNAQRNYLYVSGYDGTLNPTTRICDRGYDTHSCNGVLSALASGLRLKASIELPGLNGTPIPDPSHRAVWFLSDNAGLSYGPSACGRTGSDAPYSTVYYFKDDLSHPAQGVGERGVLKNLPGVVASRAVFNSKTKRFYVSDECTGNVVIFDNNWNEQGRVALGPVTDGGQSTPGTAGNLAVNTVTNKIYVTDLRNPMVHEIDGPTGEWKRGLILGDSSVNCGSASQCVFRDLPFTASGVAVGTKANKVYVTDQASGNLAVVDVRNNHQISLVNLNGVTDPSSPSGSRGNTLVSVLEKKGVVLVANWDQSSLTVINGTTGAIVQQISLGQSNKGTTAQSNDCFGLLSNGETCLSFGDNVQGLVVHPSKGTVYVSTMPLQGVWEAGAVWTENVGWYNAENPGHPLSTTSTPLWGSGKVFVLKPTAH